MNTRTQAVVDFTKKMIVQYAQDSKWEQRQCELVEGRLQLWFKRDDVMMMIEPKTRTVVTHMTHKGKQKILRRTGLFITEMKRIFDNPRIHTGKGKQLKIKNRNHANNSRRNRHT